MQHNVKVIALAGKMGYGKTTIAKMIQAADHRTKITSFAEPLKGIVAGIFPELTDFHLKDQIGKNQPTALLNGHSPRQVMQFFGTDFIRKYDPDYWVKLGEKKILEARRVPQRGKLRLNFIVFDDCRFENEVELVRKYDGCIIHLERDEPETGLINKIRAKFSGGINSHASEAGVRKFFDSTDDYVINTSESTETTNARIAKMVSQGFSPDYQL